MLERELTLLLVLLYLDECLRFGGAENNRSGLGNPHQARQATSQPTGALEQRLYGPVMEYQEPNGSQ